MNIEDCVLDVPLDHASGLLYGCVRVQDGTRVVQHICAYKNLNLLPATAQVRINSACITSEVFGCNRCDCGWQLRYVLRLFSVSSIPCLLIYSPDDEGRGHGLFEKLKSYQGTMPSPESGLEQRYRQADHRDFATAAYCVHWFGIRQAIHLGQNPAKTHALQVAGVKVEVQRDIISPESSMRRYYEFRESQ
jgi:GTP cyclohydrolase II